MGTIYFAGMLGNSIRASRTLSVIETNPAGRVIISRIKESKRDLTITPYTDGGCNAGTKSVDPIGSGPRGVGKYDPTKWYAGYEDDPRTRQLDERTLAVQGTATGAGSDVIISFTPDIYGKSGCYQGASGSLADEILFHEMIHGLRTIQGRLNPRPMGNSFSGYTNEEEFLAVVATNVYISAKGSTDFRADHTGHLPLKPPLNTSAGFLGDPDNLKLMKILHLTWREPFLALGGVDAKYNPFRELTARLEYLEDPV